MGGGFIFNIDRGRGVLHSGFERRRIQKAEEGSGIGTPAASGHSVRGIHVLFIPNNWSRPHGSEQGEGRTMEVGNRTRKSPKNRCLFRVRS